MKQLSHNEIQQESFEILKFIDDICRVNNIDYIMIYGTLLGAARHQGFIPWDDDVDIAIPRIGYERLRKILTTENLGFRFFDHTTIKDYPYLIGRVSSNKTWIRREDEHDCEMGVFVDVYPIDNLGNSRLSALAKATILGIFSSMYFASTRTKFEPYCNGKLLKKIYIIISRMIGAPRLQVLMGLIAKKSTKGLNQKYVGSAMWMTIKSRRNVLPLKYFTRFTDIEFNGRVFKAPEDYDEFLTHYYGNYRALPPVEQQKPHHEYKAYYV